MQEAKKFLVHDLRQVEKFCAAGASAQAAEDTVLTDIYLNALRYADSMIMQDLSTTPRVKIDVNSELLSRVATMSWTDDYISPGLLL